MTEAFSVKSKNLARLGYLLQLLGALFFITAVIGVLINHTHWEQLKGTAAQSHCRWQIQTFWISTIAGTISILLIQHTIAQYLLISTIVWFYYRAIRGFWALQKNLPAPAF